MKSEIDYSIYLVTDSGLMSTATLTDAVEQAIQGGCTVVQLREKDLPFEEFCGLGRQIKAITNKYSVPLIINDNIDVALRINAAGVHIGQGDIPYGEVRKLIGNNKIVGVSVSNLQEAKEAQTEGADYIGVGAMFATGTKTDANIVSREELIAITQEISIPIVVIGGINEKTLSCFNGIAIDGVAVVSAIIAQKDIKAAATNMKKLFDGIKQLIFRGIKAAVFDLDGTLIDSMGIWERIDIEFLKKRGFEVPTFYLNEICARSFREASEYTIELFGLKDTVESLIDEWNNMALYEYSHNIRLKTGAEEYLRRLKSSGIKLAVCTSLPPYLNEPVLKNNNVYELFERICSVDEVTRGKEYTDVFDHTIKLLGLAPHECMFFEDLLPAVKSAKKTGACVCGVYDDSSKEFASSINDAADCYIKDFSKAPILKK